MRRLRDIGRADSSQTLPRHKTRAPPRSYRARSSPASIAPAHAGRDGHHASTALWSYMPSIWCRLRIARWMSSKSKRHLSPNCLTAVKLDAVALVVSETVSTLTSDKNQRRSEQRLAQNWTSTINQRVHNLAQRETLANRFCARKADLLEGRNGI